MIYIDNPLKVVYNGHYYWITIVRDNDNYYWYMRGYNKQFMVITDENTDNFHLVLNDIIK